MIISLQKKAQYNFLSGGKKMPYKNHGFRSGFLAALNRCITTPLFTASPEAGQGGENRPVPGISCGMRRNISRERYLAIPTFIRQGKTLGL